MTEHYNEYGEIINITPIKPYQRTLSHFDKHRIHETKDLYTSECSYCVQKIIKYKIKNNKT